MGPQPVSPPPQSVGSVYSGLMQGVGAAEKVFEFIDRQPTMVHDGNLAPDHLEGRVDFENVTFTYRTRPHTKVLQVRWALEACSDRPAPRPVTQAAAHQAASLPRGAWAPIREDRSLAGGRCGRGRPQGRCDSRGGFSEAVPFEEQEPVRWLCRKNIPGRGNKYEPAARV